MGRRRLHRRIYEDHGYHALRNISDGFNGQRVIHHHFWQRSFTATSNKLFFPHDGAKVDFVAYYPYNANVSAGIYPVNIKDQTKEANIDLMYADNVKNVNASSSANVLNFKHQLARIKFTIKSTDGKSLTGLTATLNNMSTTADFKLATGEFANLSATADVK